MQTGPQKKRMPEKFRDEDDDDFDDYDPDWDPFDDDDLETSDGYKTVQLEACDEVQ